MCPIDQRPGDRLLPASGIPIGIQAAEQPYNAQGVRTKSVNVMGKHEIEVAKSRVRIVDGNVEVLSDPLVKQCPLRSHLYGCEEEDRER